MFKDLKIIKLVVIASFFVYIIQSSFLKFNISNSFFQVGSLEENEPIELFVASNYNDSKKKIEIKDLYGNLIHDTVVSVKKNYQISEPENYLSDGYPVDQNFIISRSKIVKSGIYEIDGAPFVVKSQKETDITIVYPYVNNQFFTKTEDGYFFNEKRTHLNLNRKIPIDKYTIGMAKEFLYLDSAYSTNYITDIDLEDKNTFANSKLLIVYGRSSFWTTAMRKNMLDYFYSGGNILIITSKIFYTKLWKNEKKNVFRTVPEDEEMHEKNLETWAIKKEDSPFVKIGLTSKYGGFAKNLYKSSYAIANKNHSIFDKVESDSVPIEGKLFMGALIQWKNGVAVPENLSIQEYQDLSKLDVEILAYLECKGLYENSNSGIFIVNQKDSPGKIVAFGTEDWCLKKNQDKKEIQQITRNSIRYLLGK